MKKVLLICYVAVMTSLVLGFYLDTKNNINEPVIQYEHTISSINEDDYNQLILDGWVLDNTIVLFTDTVYVLTYTDIDLNVSTIYTLKVVSP